MQRSRCLVDGARRAFAMLTLAASTVALPPPTQLQAQSNPIVIELNELDRLSGQREYREVIRRAASLRTQARSQMGNRTKIFSDVYAIATQSQAYAHSELGEFKQAEGRWRREWDSNPRYGFPYTRFPSERLKPLGHPSGNAAAGAI